MINKIKFMIIILMISSCSGNQSVTNPVTGEKPTPGLFSKDSEKGISISDILNRESKEGISVNVNGY